MEIIIIIIIVIVLFIKFYEPIFDLIMGIVEFFEGVGDFFKRVKNGVSDKKEEHERRIYEAEQAKKENQEYLQYQYFENAEELPKDIDILNGLRKSFRKNGDTNRAFLCLKNAVELNVGSLKEKEELNGKLAEYYRKAIGTEQNLELERVYQAKSLLYYIQSVAEDDQKIVAKIKDVWKGKYPADLECLYLAAKELCEQKNPIGVFILEDVMLAKNNGVVIAANKERRKEIYQKMTTNAYALFHLWCMNESEKQFLERSAELGCYYAAVILKKSNLVQNLKTSARKGLANGFTSACEYVNSQSEDSKQAKVLFEQGKDAYSKNANNKEAIRQIEEAAGLGNEQASLWLLQYRAENGEKEYEYELATLYEKGTYWVKQNQEKAAMLYMRSAIQGYAEAQYRYGQMLEFGEFGTPKNKQQADIQYINAADQDYVPACMKIGEEYSHGDAEKKAIAEKYLRKVTTLDLSVKGNAKLVRKAWHTLMQMYRNYEFHNEPYPNLGKAFVCAVEYIRLTESDNKEKIDAIPKALAGDRASVGTLAKDYIVKIQNKQISEEEAKTVIIPIYETITLQEICIYEMQAEMGNVDAMRNLFFSYDEVGSCSIGQKMGISIVSVRFSGNRAKCRYWLDRAIALGDTRAMRYKGEYYYIYGTSEEEGKAYLEMAASRGDEMAKEDLEIKQLEVETKARYAAEARALAESLKGDVSGHSSSDESGPIPIEFMPGEITGPYGHKYRLVMRGAYSAEYENVDSGVRVTINESQIGAMGATTEEGYFYW